jgi:hypothetical protein
MKRRRARSAPEALRGDTQKGGKAMRLVKRLAVAVGSLLALVLAGGAHIKF